MPVFAVRLLIASNLGVGALLRIARWLHFRAFWLDEIYLARSVVPRSLHQLLFAPLEDWQAAPAGFLAMVHASVKLFGPGEKSLRLTSLLFGLASMPIFCALARRCLGVVGTVSAVAAFSFLGPLIYYSNELKPYMCDVFVSLAITLAVIRWYEKRDGRSAILAAIVGIAGIFFSFPSIFVLAGAGFWMLFHPGAPRKQIVAVGSAWLIAFAADYLLFLRPFTVGEAHPHLVQYWAAQNAFMPRWPMDAAEWIFATLARIAASPGAMWLDYPDAALIGIIIGLACALVRRGNLLLIVFPLPIVLLASALRQYPFGDRLALFFVPQYLILMGAGAEWLWTNLPGKVAAFAIVGCVVVPSADRAIGYLFNPPGREESLAVYRWTAQHFRNGDQVYLTHFAEPSFNYYETESNWPVNLKQSGALHIQGENLEPWEIAAEVRTLSGYRRVWLIAIHAEGGEFNVEQATESAFHQIGRATNISHAEPGAVAQLFDCSRR